MILDNLTNLYPAWSPSKSTVAGRTNSHNIDSAHKKTDKGAHIAEPRVIYTSPALPSNLRRRPATTSWSAGDFELNSKISQSKVCSVFKAKYKYTNYEVILKIFFKTRLSAIGQHQMAREIDIHSRLSHPNIIPLYGVFEERDSVVLILQYASEGDLLAYASQHPGRCLAESRVIYFVVNILHSLDYLHQNGIVHRDIKPENVVITDTSVKIIDFGVSIDVRRERPVSAVGTPEYMSPEVALCPLKRTPSDFKGRFDLHYTAAADIWSVGILVWELLVGSNPFHGHNPAAVKQCVTGTSPEIPTNVSTLARSFIAAATERNPSNRPTAAELLQHQWLRLSVFQSEQDTCNTYFMGKSSTISRKQGRFSELYLRCKSFDRPKADVTSKAHNQLDHSRSRLFDNVAHFVIRKSMIGRQENSRQTLRKTTERTKYPTVSSSQGHFQRQAKKGQTILPDLKGAKRGCAHHATKTPQASCRPLPGKHAISSGQVKAFQKQQVLCSTMACSGGQLLKPMERRIRQREPSQKQVQIHVSGH
uniref:Serine threonine protein kinase n=1 Tax=Tetraselmis sp. GSL018 TaxID=582737 RepID=A0A061SNM3_9CHLO|mmetsp:Transcript_26276/g.62473  ORF Transcript_26276/g.62473 Transcript_26276/m.62473 type:complete len:534 (+) Transcript_26276:257-1858(+)